MRACYSWQRAAPASLPSACTGTSSTPTSAFRPLPSLAQCHAPQLCACCPLARLHPGCPCLARAHAFSDAQVQHRAADAERLGLQVPERPRRAGHSPVLHRAHVVGPHSLRQLDGPGCRRYASSLGMRASMHAMCSPEPPACARVRRQRGAGGAVLAMATRGMDAPISLCRFPRPMRLHARPICKHGAHVPASAEHVCAP